jgi:8-oxo-dGTP pyrophosphatase MutT (NUDIX family)
LDGIEVKSFIMTDVNMFGPNVGFYKGTADAYEISTGIKIMSNICFNRGSCVCCLVIITNSDTSEKFVLLTKQPRVPAGRFCIEALAGMVDNNTSNLAKAMFAELKEEAGIIISINDPGFINLGNPFWHSQGGSDEYIQPYALELTMSSSEISSKLGRLFGVEDERIHLCIIPIDRFENELSLYGDAKAEICWYRYMSFLQKKSITCCF